jgi:ferredoxin
MSSVASFVPADRMHLERFVAIARESTLPETSLEVTCKKSKKNFTVEPGESILTALEENGLPVLGSCKKGVCGTCEVRVVDGTPIHLDSVIDDAEKDRLKVMYPCVSRAEGSKLVLDI